MRINTWAGVAVLGGVFAAGAAAMYLWAGQTSRIAPAATARAAHGEHAAASASPTRGNVITIPSDLMQRAGIVVESAGTSGAASQLHVPGTVQPNAYRKVTVTPLVGGRVTRVLVDLGQTVARGAVLAEVYSPDVAQARAGYLKARADMQAGESRLRRTERLAALGSASQQELDDVRAEHVGHETELREAAARLRLFGLDPAQFAAADAHTDLAASVIRVTSPQSGVVIERPATAGMTAEPSTPLVTVAELSPVWVITEVYERDLARVSMNAPALVVSEAYPGVQLHGRVTYVSPEIRPETRTAQLRVEVPNPDGKLRFGMYVSVTLGRPVMSGTVTIPKAAVQTIGVDAIVFVPEGSSANMFTERRVTLGEADTDRVAITAGLNAGERVVTQGSFTLRAEAERQGIRPPEPSTTSAASASGPVQTLTVEVTEKGFGGGPFSVKAGVPVRMTFIRKTDATCATDLAIPEYGIKRPLPLNTAVTVEFTPRKDVTFQCGMGMLSGTLTVR